MFDNVLYQNAVTLLCEDVLNNTLAQSLLLCGTAAQGKLTSALELARVLSCRVTGEARGSWACACSSCLAHKVLTHPDLVVAGPRDCILEIIAAKNTLLQAVANSASHIQAASYLFIRSVRKLTARFNPLLWADDDKASKIGPLVSAVDEALENIDTSRSIPVFAELEKSCESILASCVKLENAGMYESLPIAQIRRISSWARLTTGGGKKTLIIENADRMQEGARNALLKILEEPPEQTVFILTAQRRTAVLPTLLSRVRTYSFAERSVEQQREVISRIFHVEPSPFQSVSDYLYTLLPVPKQKITILAKEFLSASENSGSDLCRKIVSEAGNFEPRFLFRLFLYEITQLLKTELHSSAATGQTCRIIQKKSEAVRFSLEQVLIYNQSPAAALELLAETFSRVTGGVL